MNLVELTPLLSADVEPLFRWFNNEADAALDFAFRPIDWPSHHRWFETIGQDLSKVVFAIRLLAFSRLLGIVTLSQINTVHHSAEIGIRIGEERDRKLGYGTEALKSAVQYAQNTMHLHRLCANVVVENSAASRLFAKVGFVAEGHAKAAVFLQGRYHDIVHYAYLMDAAHSHDTQP